MTNHSSRTFEDKLAVRTAVPLLVGLTGASGSGKTFSALRIATGIQKVTGGEIGYIDTEARRALHYADRFKFRHLPFGSPFGSLDYLAAVEHFATKGCRVIVVDSMSHEHEGPGGVLEQHECELDRIAGDDWKKRERSTFLAWAKPKAERRRLINSLLQLPVNMVFCFRAKEKIKIESGRDENGKSKPPTALGWMPIAGEEFVYEMTVNCLLYPNCGGVPEWSPTEPGEKVMVKLPEQFRALFAQRRPLDEETGEALAKWAAGTETPTVGRATAATSKLIARIIELSGGADHAEARILARNVDDAGLITAGKAIKAGSATFDSEFPPLPTDRVPGIDD
jgi:energy-coupling factor transporter ATP-binding protein EcfA2